MNDRTDRMAPPNPASGAAIPISEVKFGKLVQQPRGPVVAGFEHAITSRSRDMPPDVVDACRPDLLVPADANPIQMVESWAQEQGGLVIVPLLRPRVPPSDRLWTIAGRIRPYTERGVGQGGRPASMMTVWPLPSAAFARTAPALVASMGSHFRAEPELAGTAAAERMARPPVSVPARMPAVATVGQLPRPAIAMLDALRRGKPTRWTRATFADEQAYLECLAVVCLLIPEARGGVQPRGLLSASSGLAIGSDHFLISYVRDGAPSNDEKAEHDGRIRIPPAWEGYLARSASEPISELVSRARSAARSIGMEDDWGRYVFGHSETQDGEFAAEGLVRALDYYRNPGQARPVAGMIDAVRRDLVQPSGGTPLQRDIPTARAISPAAYRGNVPPGYPPGATPSQDQARLVTRAIPPAHHPARGFAATGSPPVGQPPPSPRPSQSAVRPPDAAPPQARPAVGPPQRPPAAEPWIARYAADLRSAAHTSEDVQQHDAAFPIMAAMIGRMLHQGVLDTDEMRQIFDWSIASRQDIFGRLFEWTGHTYPNGPEVNDLRSLVHRSAALQAWRDGSRGGSPPQRLTPADIKLQEYAQRWRETFEVKQSPQWCAEMAGEAVAALIARTMSGFPPVLDFAALEGLKPILHRSGRLRHIEAALAAAMRQVPPPAERNGLPPGTAAAVLRGLGAFVQSI